MRLRIARVVLLSCTLFVILDVISCRIFDDVMSPADANGLVRSSIDTPSGLRLSYISGVTTETGRQRLIFVHGTPGNAKAFERYLLDPLPGFESISIDRPGFGKTRPRTALPGLRDQALALEPLLVERDGAWPILIGHSLGGPIIARAAAEFPDRVGGLVILSGSLDPSLEKIAWYQRVANFAFVPHMIPRALRNSNRELYPLKRQLEVLQPLLAKIRCPVLIVHARDDSLVPYDNVAYMNENFAEGVIREVVVLQGKDHFIPWNAEPEIREAILRLAAATAPHAPSAGAETITD